VPAAAVTPAPIVYLNVVAVKKLVVEFLRGRLTYGYAWPPHPRRKVLQLCLVLDACFTLKKLECSRQALLEYISME